MGSDRTENTTATLSRGRGSDLVSHLRHVSLFAALSEDSLLGIAGRCRRRVFPAGSVLFFENDPGHALYILLSGKVTIEKSSGSGEGGGTVFLAERGAGDVVGEMALFDGQARSATAIARTACEALLLDRDGFLECVRQEPDVALQIIAVLSERLRESGRQAARQGALDVLGRLAAYLLEQAEPQTSASPRRVPRRSDREVGEQIGATRETVNRKLARLAAMGILRYEVGQIVLLDEPRLRALSEGGFVSGKA